ncbi:enolase C-terminal domain-like protein [Membranihabitans maritimus]|uniref:enolase C-terminal domain-like protein n=1 Tax=Membranihabitans maritimus TaxID=2904244 RepID=UPI001F2AC055|nr:enolase C-terminal domain-like protein [Membranihabitans maritimus]
MNRTVVIKKVLSVDKRFKLQNGAGTDAIHTGSYYAYSVCRLVTDGESEGIGLAFTLGEGNQLVCDAIVYLAKYVEGKEIGELMSNFGETFKAMADDPGFRWLGPQKGIVHLALASIVNACFDLWAKTQGVPLWDLLISCSPEEIINTLDFSYFEEVLTRQEAVDLLRAEEKDKEERKSILLRGYPGYDTSIGWLKYSDSEVMDKVREALDAGFNSMKLKVGSEDSSRDIRRAHMLREMAGPNARIMFDVNQQWSLDKAISLSGELEELNPFWLEEPTHPDDLIAHIKLSENTSIPLALGEHIPNKVLFKNFIQAGCMSFNQVDAVRVGGVSEFILISLLSRKFKIPVVPHVGDMGQIHQHLVLFNHISVGHPVILLEHIPHLRNYFKFPVDVCDGVYKVPQSPGMSADLVHY